MGARNDGPYESGQKVRDGVLKKQGVILDSARQYAHPKAKPVHQYLVRWDDGQVEALTETALAGSHGIELAD